jgi:hypothetical protein
MNYYQKKFPNLETRFDKKMQKIKNLNENRSKKKIIKILKLKRLRKINIELKHIEKFLRTLLLNIEIAELSRKL